MTNKTWMAENYLNWIIHILKIIRGCEWHFTLLIIFLYLNKILLYSSKTRQRSYSLKKWKLNKKYRANFDGNKFKGCSKYSYVTSSKYHTLNMFLDLLIFCDLFVYIQSKALYRLVGLNFIFFWWVYKLGFFPTRTSLNL